MEENKTEVLFEDAKERETIIDELFSRAHGDSVKIDPYAVDKWHYYLIVQNQMMMYMEQTLDPNAKMFYWHKIQAIKQKMFEIGEALLGDTFKYYEPKAE